MYTWLGRAAVCRKHARLSVGCGEVTKITISFNYLASHQYFDLPIWVCVSWGLGGIVGDTKGYAETTFTSAFQQQQVNQLPVSFKLVRWTFFGRKHCVHRHFYHKWYCYGSFYLVLTQNARRQKHGSLECISSAVKICANYNVLLQVAIRQHNEIIITVLLY